MRFENKAGVKFEVDFAHRKEKMMVPPTAPVEKQKEVEALITTAAIKTDAGEQGRTITAQAICRPPDQFSKPLGRKLALTRALKISGFDEETKTLIWEKYIKSLDVKRKVIAGFGVANQNLLFIQTPTKAMAKSTKQWQSSNGIARKTKDNSLAVIACPLPMDHPFFLEPEKYGFKVVN